MPKDYLKAAHETYIVLPDILTLKIISGSHSCCFLEQSLFKSEQSKEKIEEKFGQKVSINIDSKAIKLNIYLLKQ